MGTVNKATWGGLTAAATQVLVYFLDMAPVIKAMPPEVHGSLEFLLTGVLTGLVVYFVPNGQGRAPAAPVAALLLACLVLPGCGKRVDPNPPRQIDPLAVANAVAGALVVAEQAQAIEAVMFLSDETPNREAHCTVQRAFGAFARNAQNAIAVVFDLTYPGTDRSGALRALVDGSAQTVALVADRLSDEEEIALRAALAAGTVAVLTVTAQRMPSTAPPDVYRLRDGAVAGLQRMQMLAVSECPESKASLAP